MNFTRKFYMLSASLVMVSLLSYVSFTYFEPSLNFAKKNIEDVKGYFVSSPFSFLPSLGGAEEIRSNLSSDGFERSYLISSECTQDIQRFYANVLVEKGWEVERLEKNENVESSTYKKNPYKIIVSSFNDPNNEECLVTLVGFSSN